MANNKKNNKKANKKTVEKQTEVNIKDLFVEEAQNTTFTEEDVKELEESRCHTDNVGETTEEIENIESMDDENKVQQTTNSIPEIPSNDMYDSESEKQEKEHTEYTDKIGEIQESVVTTNEKETLVSEKSSSLDGVGEYVPVNENKHKQTPKRRITTKEAYGYHWMGLIYDE